jgi:hypothetical protein
MAEQRDDNSYNVRIVIDNENGFGGALPGSSSMRSLSVLGQRVAAASTYHSLRPALQSKCIQRSYCTCLSGGKERSCDCG